MLVITKTEEGLNWFDRMRYFTKSQLELGWEKVDDYSIHCELDNNLIYIDSREVIVNGVSFQNSEELISFIFL